jgi:hypothetical protein
MPDAELKRILKQLGEAISETLAESPKIIEHLQCIKDSGYELMLVIEAKVGVNTKNEKRKEYTPELPDEPVRLRITPEDAKFLKSLKISTD